MKHGCAWTNHIITTVRPLSSFNSDGNGLETTKHKFLFSFFITQSVFLASLHLWCVCVCAIVVVIVVVVFIINSVHSRAETSVYVMIVIINFVDNVLHYVCLSDWAVYIILNFTFAPMLSMLVLHVWQRIAVGLAIMNEMKWIQLIDMSSACLVYYNHSLFSVFSFARPLVSLVLSAEHRYQRVCPSNMMLAFGLYWKRILEKN